MADYINQLVDSLFPAGEGSQTGQGPAPDPGAAIASKKTSGVGQAAGMLAGGLVGSAFGPIGTSIGSTVGGFLGDAGEHAARQIGQQQIPGSAGPSIDSGSAASVSNPQHEHAAAIAQSLGSLAVRGMNNRAAANGYKKVF